MSTIPGSTPGSWQRLKYVLPTLGLLLAADSRGTILHFTLSVGMGLFPLAEVHVLRRLIETAELIVGGSAPVAAGLAWGLALALLGILHAAVIHVREIVDRRHQEVLGNTLRSAA